MKWLSFVLLLVLSACSPWREIPDDLQFVALHPRIEPYSKNPAWDFIDVEFETNFNYNNYVAVSAVDVNSKIYFCDQPDVYVEMLGGMNIYREGGRWISLTESVLQDVNPPYHYHTSINLVSHQTHSSGAHFPVIIDYDLHKTPRDLCLYFDALNGLFLTGWSHTKSNIVRIPKEELIKFFADHPRPQAGQ